MKMMAPMWGSQFWLQAGFQPAVGAVTDPLRAMKGKWILASDAADPYGEPVTSIFETDTIFRGAAPERERSAYAHCPEIGPAAA
jgi:hypothetical protein